MKKRNNKRVLVVDDNETILMSLSIIIRNAGYEVKTETNGKKVLEISKEFPDLIILDVMMPEIGGVEVCRKLKKDKRMREIPVVLISASNDLALSAKNARADGFMSKPFTMSTFIKTVAEHLWQ